MDYDRDAEPLERHPAVSQEAECQECNCNLFQIGTFYACQEPACGRYAIPVNEYGNTDAEQEVEDSQEAERRQAWGAQNY